MKEFKSFLFVNNYGVGLRETKLDVKYKLKISGYKVYLNSRNSRGGGVAIAIKQNIEHCFYKAERYGDIEFVGVKISLNVSVLNIGQVYKPPNKPLTFDNFGRLEL